MTTNVALISSFIKDCQARKEVFNPIERNTQPLKHEISSLGLFWPSCNSDPLAGTIELDLIEFGSSPDHSTSSYHFVDHSFL